MIRSISTKIVIVFSLFSLCSCLANLSSTHVINGVDGSEYTAVVPLTLNNNGDCSAGVISDSTLLTAAHCLQDITNASELTVTLANGSKATAKQFAYHEKFVMQQLITTATYDIGVVVFDDNTFSDIQPLTVAGKIPEVGTKVRLVGYGCWTTRGNGSNYFGLYNSYGYGSGNYGNYGGYGGGSYGNYGDYGSGSGYGTGGYGGSMGIGGTVECDESKGSSQKRTGTSEVTAHATCAPHMLELIQKKGKVDSEISTPTGEDSDTAPGDSGSPVLLESDHTKIVGITSYGGVDFSDNKPSCYSDPTYSENVEFLKQSITKIGAKIPWLSSASMKRN